MVDLVLSLVMLSVILLLLGAFVMWRRTRELKQPALMVILAIIALANVLIWTVPSSDGTSPLENAETAEAR